MCARARALIDLNYLSLLLLLLLLALGECVSVIGVREYVRSVRAWATDFL